MSNKRRNPKKDKGARRRRPDRPEPAQQARFQVEDLAKLMAGADPAGLPLITTAGLWLWNLSEDGRTAADCIDGCLIVHHSLAQYGLQSEIHAVGVAITAGEQRVVYDNARYDQDGYFDGHTILFVPAAHRIVDPTIQQFAQIPYSRQNSLPLVGKIPDGARFGSDVFGLDRGDHVVVYLPLPEPERSAWRSPNVVMHEAKHRAAGAELAARAFDIMRRHNREKLALSPYPRLHVLLKALDGTEGDTRNGRYCFVDPGSGAELDLADVP